MLAMTMPFRDLVDRAVPVLSSVLPLESWVLSDAKYQARLAALQAAMRRPAAYDLVILGDSHAQYVEGHRLFSGMHVLNLGIARDTTIGVAGRLGMIPAHVTAADYWIEVGYNDLKYRDVAAIAENIGRIMAAVGTRTGTGHVLVQGLFPVEAKRRFTNRKIRDLNARLQGLCGEVGCVYVDVMRVFSGPDGGLDARYSKDGTHLNQAGNDEWVKLLLAQLKH